MLDYFLSDIYNLHPRARGATDNASDYGSEDCRFESCRARNKCLLDFFGLINLFRTLYCQIETPGFFQGCPENQHFGRFPDIQISGFINKTGQI